MMEDLIRLLHEGNHSLVVANAEVRTFDGRGVADLYGLLRQDPEFLRGAIIADRVVGKAAAALMISGGVKEVFADVVSRPALRFLRQYGVTAGCGTVVPHIINRTRTDWCPLEIRCRDCRSPQECLEQVEEFIKLQTQK